MKQLRKDRAASLVKEIAAEFFARASSGRSLMTVTGVTLSDDLKRGTILISVFPEKLEKEALAFGKRKRSELRKAVQSKTLLPRIPLLDVKIDEGERNRRRIDDVFRTL